MAAEVNRSLWSLGDLTEARRQAERILILRPPERARARCFGHIALAGILLGQRELDAACATATLALDTSRTLRSALVTQELQQFAIAAAPYRSARAVTLFPGRYNDTINQA